MSTRFRWVTVLSLTVLLMMAGVLPAQRPHRGPAPQATPVNAPTQPHGLGHGGCFTDRWLVDGRRIGGWLHLL